MKKTRTVKRATATIGLDLGDRFGHYCVLDGDGEIVCEKRVRMTRQAVTEVFTEYRGARIAIETGTHALWISELLCSLGLEVIVANAREVSAISGSDRKKDRHDAFKLAMYARADVRILRPVKLRASEVQADLVLIRARAALVESRTQLVNTARGLVKGFGYRLPDCTTTAFSNKALPQLPAVLQDQLIPLLAVIDTVNLEIQSYDRAIELMARQRYPETGFLQQVNGVGPLTALTFVLTVGDPERFASSRDVGCYVGLRPRHSQSGEYDPELGITKAGDTYLRKLLVQCSHHVLGQWGQDSALKRWGLKLVQKGGKNAKKRAVVAVARKLSVLLHKLWSTKAIYQPFFGMSEPVTA